MAADTAQSRQTDFSPTLRLNIERLRALFGNSSDFVVREITIRSGQNVALFYLDGMIDQKMLQEVVIASLMDRSPPEMTSLVEIGNTVLNVGAVTSPADMEEAALLIMSGSLLLLMNQEKDALSIALPGWEERSITESKTQTVVRGPQDSFTETLRTNTTLVRRRIKDTRIRLTGMKVGRITKTDVALMYLEGVADNRLIRQLEERLGNARLDQVLEGQYLEELLLEQRQSTIFPTLYNSDRPDTIAAGIMEGKIAIFIDGTPFVLLVPSLFVDFLQSAEDYYQPILYSNLIRIMRYIAVTICILAPAIYISLTTFHQDMLPTQMLLSLAAQREGVPFPAFIEALIMEVTFEILREAGVRMPRTIGQAVSIVGTIVIGQAAVEAGVVSAVLVIVVSITAITSFVIPAYAMSIPIRILRFAFMCLAASFGAFGVTIGILVLLVHLCSLRSFGVPYMSPIAPFDSKEQSDAIFRFPFRKSANLNPKRRSSR
ncbi:spore germination protein [Cohnella lupini]|uniref:Spore germination protein KA n=1 Tax=Cohnella lupini TaxID=1294267 RepID=A0A3D9IFA4_9BACL|nr:spore germination protein [Cohnella lupini]RED60229.1 spore germination protein KA [Cohnella lupini]